VNLWRENLIILTHLPKFLIDFWKNRVQIDNIKLGSYFIHLFASMGETQFLQNNFTILT